MLLWILVIVGPRLKKLRSTSRLSTSDRKIINIHLCKLCCEDENLRGLSEALLLLLLFRLIFFQISLLFSVGYLQLKLPCVPQFSKFGQLLLYCQFEITGMLFTGSVNVIG